MIFHHVGHGGYNSEVGTDSRYHRMNFGKGPVRRFLDWCDWMQPEAWDVEHNFYHHYFLGEERDPDVLEVNAYEYRNAKYPTAVKTMQMAAISMIWKWFYYSPNTQKEMYKREIELKANKGEVVEQPFKLPEAPDTQIGRTEAATIQYVFEEMGKGNFEPAKVLFSSLAPYFTAHFVITPGIFYALFGPEVASTAFINLLIAELLTNLHTFCIVVPNHTGGDIYRFETPVNGKSDDFYLRAVIGSTNFNTGGNVNDALHGWLNYQVQSTCPHFLQ